MIIVMIVIAVMVTFLLMMEDTMSPRQPTVPVMSLVAYMTLGNRRLEITER